VESRFSAIPILSTAVAVFGFSAIPILSTAVAVFGFSAIPILSTAVAILPRMTPCPRDFGLGLAALGLYTFAVLSGCLANGFLNWDDAIFLTQGNAVLRFDVAEMSRQVVLANYHPITLLSLAIDHRLFGLDPFYFHLTNLLLHVANTLLVVIFVRRLLPEGPSLFVPFLCGALFAVHPMHVESVAWVAARKDLLSTAFILMALVAYLEYRQRERGHWYAAALLAFTLAVLSKPVAVMTPLVMLALDWSRSRRPEPLRLVPFFAVAVAAGVANVISQTPPDAERFAIYDGSLPSRLGIAVQSLIFYVSKTLVPHALSAYYDIDRVRVAPYQVALTAAAVAGTAILLVKKPGLRREVGFGALFFLLTVAPMLKLVPFGGNSLFNDRYMYLPSLGLFLIIARAVSASPIPRGFVWAGSALVIGIFSVQSVQRVAVWHDSGTFWQDVLEKVPGTPVALNNLGRYYLDELDDLDRAQESFESAVRERPEYSTPHYNLGVIHQRRGNWKQATGAYERAVELAPDDVDARIGVGVFYLSAGDRNRAIAHLEAADATAHGSALARHNLGVAHFGAGRLEAAEEAYRLALEIEPRLAPTWASLGDVHRAQRRPAEALACYERAAELGHPVDPDLLHRLRRRAGQ
jgi:Flp pilus assembly protein TadD